MDVAVSAGHEAFPARVGAFARGEVEPRAAEIDVTALYPRAFVARALSSG